MHCSPMVSPKDKAAVQEALVITKLPSGHASHEKLPENSIFERRKKMDNHPILEINYIGFGINPCVMIAMAIRIVTKKNGDKTGN
jgi:hypothetical protein